jgi:hypothetical protein
MMHARFDSIDGLYRQEEVDEAIARGTAVCLVETAKEVVVARSPRHLLPGRLQKMAA